MSNEESPRRGDDATPLTHTKKKLVEARLLSENYEMLAKEMPPIPPSHRCPSTSSSSAQEPASEAKETLSDFGGGGEDDYDDGDSDCGESLEGSSDEVVDGSVRSCTTSRAKTAQSDSSSLPSDLSTLSLAYSLGLSSYGASSLPDHQNNGGPVTSQLLSDIDDAMSNLDAWKTSRARQLSELLAEYPLSPSSLDDDGDAPLAESGSLSPSPPSTPATLNPASLQSFSLSSHQHPVVPQALHLPPLSAGVQALLDDSSRKLERYRVDHKTNELMRSAAASAPLSARRLTNEAHPNMSEEKWKSQADCKFDGEDVYDDDENDETDADLKECRSRLERNKLRMQQLESDLADMERQAVTFSNAMLGTDAFFCEGEVGGDLDDVLKRIDELEGRRGSRDESKENPQGH